MILNAIGDLGRVRALVHLEAVRDSILIKNIVQFAGIDAQSVLVAYIDRNAVILAQVVDVLVNKGEGRVGDILSEGTKPKQRQVFHSRTARSLMRDSQV